jgi:hypothetical protein
LDLQSFFTFRHHWYIHHWLESGFLLLQTDTPKEQWRRPAAHVVATAAAPPV